MDEYRLSEDIRRILNEIEHAGFRAYLVGGCVRDMLMGLEPADFDIASSALPEDNFRIFKRVIPTGIKHGTVTVLDFGFPVEVTTFRSDGEYRDGRHPEAVEFVGGIEDDLSRRDFTVNAMAMDAAGNIIDPFGGRADIDRRLIRTVGNPDRRFREDALRMFRAVRFSARGFKIDAETESAIQRGSELAVKLSVERIYSEVKKILVSQYPGRVGLLAEYGLLERFGLDRASAGHTDFSNLERLPADEYLRLCGWLGILVKNGVADSAERLMRDMKAEARQIRMGGLIDRHIGRMEFKSATDIKLLIYRRGARAAMGLAAGYEAAKETGMLRRVGEILQSGECCTLKQLAFSGEDAIRAGYSGSGTGALLDRLVRHVIDNPSDNYFEKLDYLAREWREKHTI